MDEDTNERDGARKAFGRIPHKPETLANLARLNATNIKNKIILEKVNLY